MGPVLQTKASESDPSADPRVSQASEIEGLVSRARRGDREAFAALYRLHVQRVYTYLAYRLRDQHEAEDLTAEAFAKALRKIGDFEWRGVDFGVWLLRIARNVLLDHVRSARSRLEVVGLDETIETDETSAPGSDLEVLDKLEREMLLQALNILKPDQQEVLYLRFLQDLSTADVAKVMRKSESAIRVLQFRALKSLLRVVRMSSGSILEPAPAEGGAA